jgi:hypothetical protein
VVSSNNKLLLIATFWVINVVLVQTQVLLDVEGTPTAKYEFTDFLHIRLVLIVSFFLDCFTLKPKALPSFEKPV